MVSVGQRERAGKNPRVIPGRPALAGRPEDADHRRFSLRRMPLPYSIIGNVIYPII
jgi:hypothetical protein